ncbi:MAG: PqqD family protein [Candidatus Aegiribacteria sp.]
MESLRYPEYVVFREEPEGGILFNVDTGELKLVEDVAWGICHMIEKESDRSLILKKLEELYPEEENLKRDLDSFLEELAEAGFLLREQ